MAEFSVAAGIARGLMDFAVSNGASPRALAEASGIDPADLQDPDERVPFDKYVALMRAGQALTGDPALALHYGEAINMADLSILGLLMPASGAIMDGLAMINRFARLVIDVDATGADRFEMAHRDGGVWLVDTRPSPNDFPEGTESGFARMICGGRRGGFPAPLEVHVTHPAPAYRAEYERIFGAPVTFETGWNAMRFDDWILKFTVPPPPRYAFELLNEHAEELLEKLESPKSVRDRVEAEIAPLLRSGGANMARVAAGMGLSRATLYRKLRAEGVTFDRVLDALRHKLALQYLDRKMAVNEAAYLLGFSDRAGFSRAFKRWTGRGPGSARSRKGGDKSDSRG
jgi:AraC-like DNA-binding protein